MPAGDIRPLASIVFRIFSLGGRSLLAGASRKGELQWQRC